MLCRTFRLCAKCVPHSQVCQEYDVSIHFNKLSILVVTCSEDVFLTIPTSDIYTTIIAHQLPAQPVQVFRGTNAIIHIWMLHCCPYNVYARPDRICMQIKHIRQTRIKQEFNAAQNCSTKPFYNETTLQLTQGCDKRMQRDCSCQKPSTRVTFGHISCTCLLPYDMLVAFGNASLFAFVCCFGAAFVGLFSIILSPSRGAHGPRLPFTCVVVDPCHTRRCRWWYLWNVYHIHYKAHWEKRCRASSQFIIVPIHAQSFIPSVVAVESCQTSRSIHNWPDTWGRSKSAAFNSA